MEAWAIAPVTSCCCILYAVLYVRPGFARIAAPPKEVEMELQELPDVKTRRSPAFLCYHIVLRQVPARRHTHTSTRAHTQTLLSPNSRPARTHLSVCGAAGQSEEGRVEVLGALRIIQGPTCYDLCHATPLVCRPRVAGSRTQNCSVVNCLHVAFSQCITEWVHWKLQH